MENEPPAPGGSDKFSWAGRSIQTIEHQGHAPGHAALMVDDAGVLIASDMLSDVEIPLFDPRGADPCRDYAVALDLLAAAATSGVVAVVPGQGSVARGTDIRLRIEADRAYVRALQVGTDPADSRMGPDATYGTDWLPEAHERNVSLVQS